MPPGPVLESEPAFVPLPQVVPPVALLPAPFSPAPLGPPVGPYWRTQLARSGPVSPTHWLGTAVLPAALLSELALGLPEVLDPVLGPVLPPTVEPLPKTGALSVPPGCAHDTVATPTAAAATAAAIALTIMIGISMEC